MSKQNEPIIISNPQGGWARDYSLSNTAAIPGLSSQYTLSNSISIFRPSRMGIISPGETFAKLDDTGGYITELPLDAAATSDGNFVAVLRNGTLVKFPANLSTTTSSFIPTSPSTNEYGSIMILKDVAGTPIEYVLWTWEDASNAYLGYKTTALGGGNATFLTLTKGVPHIIFQGPTKNDIYVTNGQYLASVTITGAMASATTNATALNVGSGWVISSGTTYGNYVAFTGYRSNVYTTSYTFNESSAWIWNGYSPDPTAVIPVQDNISTRILNDNGELKLWTNGRNGTTKVWKYNRYNASFDLITESAQIGNPPRHGSVGLFQGNPHWVPQGSGNVFCIQDVVIDKQPITALHFRTTVTDNSITASDVGMLKNLISNQLFAGIKSGSSYYIYYMDYGYITSNCSFRSQLFSVPYHSTTAKFTFLFSDFGSTASVTPTLMLDYATLSVGGATDKLKDVPVFNQTNYSRASTDLSITFQRKIADVNQFYINLQMSGQVGIRAVIVDFEGSNDP